MQKTSRGLLNSVLEGGDNVADVVVGDAGAGGEAHADLEDGLGDRRLDIRGSRSRA